MSDDPQAVPAAPTPAPPEYEKPKGILGLIERVGNMLPDPATLFLIGTLFIMGLSHYAVQQGWTVTKSLPVPVMEAYTAADGTEAMRPVLDADGNAKIEWTEQTNEDGSPESYSAKSLLTGEGLFWALNSMVKNFTSFAPLGVVLVGMLGIGIAERVGLIAALLKAFMVIVPLFLLTPAMVFLGIMSSAGIDAGYVVLPPLAAALYKAAGRSPLAGLAAVFAGVAAGFNANLFPTGLDPMLAGFATTGAQVIDPNYNVNPASNWWFMIVSTFVITLVGWWVTAVFVERRMLKRSPEDGGPVTPSAEDLAAQKITGRESLGLLVAFAIFAGIATTVYFAISTDGWALFGKGPAFDRWAHAIVPIIFFTFLLPALGFGLVSGKVKGDKSVAKMLNESIAGMAPIIVLAFFAAQFIEHFKYSGLDKMLALSGGQYLGQAELSKEILMVAFIGVTMLFNLLIGSMSAKYAMFAPIFIPMFMLVGISPELTQAAYRIGDSATNIITPLNAYLVIVLVFMRQFVPKAGMGTLIATMLPYTIFFALAWTIMLVIWMATGQPLGPDGALEYVLPTGG